MTKRLGAVSIALMFFALTSGPAAALTANDEFFGRQWGMTKIGAPTAWQTGTGAGITIAIIDTGVGLQHIDLKSKVVQGHDFIDGDSNADPNGPGATEDAGHGTHVAGIAAALTGNSVGVVGVAPDAKIMPVRVLDQEGACGTEPSGKQHPPCRIEDGIRWAWQHGASVINLSLGPDISIPFLGSSFSDALEEAWNNGAICVVAAGNSSLPSNSTTEHALVIGATDRNDRIPAYSSSVGAAMWGMVAPGGADPNTDFNEADQILSTYWSQENQTTLFASFSGTSMAAPHVAGAAAVLLSLGLTPQQTVDRLLSTADPVATSVTAGHGRLNLAKAVNGLGGSGSGGSTNGGGTTGGGRTGGTRKPTGSASTASPSPTVSLSQSPSASTTATVQGDGGARTSTSKKPKKSSAAVPLAASLVIVVGAASSYAAWHKNKSG